MPSDLERIIRLSKRLEAALERDLGATGKGLHEKASSVEAKLGPDTTRDLRAVATVRNRLVHEEGYDRVDNRKDILDRAARAERAIDRLAGRKRRPQWFTAAALLTLAAVAIAGSAFVVLKIRGVL